MKALLLGAMVATTALVSEAYPQTPARAEATAVACDSIRPSLRPAATLASSQDPQAITRIIVRPRPALSAQDAGSALTEAQRSSGVLGPLPAVPNSRGEFVIETTRPLTPQEAEQLINQLRADGRFDYVDPVIRLFPQNSPNDPCYRLMWHYHARGNGPGQAPGGSNAERAWTRTQGSTAVVVAVLDTGILRSADLVDVNPAHILPGYDFIADSSNARDRDGRDSDPTDEGDAQESWHGSHVAGTIGLMRSNDGTHASSMLWTTRILPVRVLGYSGGDLVDIADAIQWSAGASIRDIVDNPNPAQIINLSLGGRGQCPGSLQSAIDDAVGRGAVVVVAAGNAAADLRNYTPANCRGVVSVSASDRNGRIAPYSNFGSATLIAPGGDTSADANQDGHPDGVLSLVRGGLAWYQGTSMAAPHVAAAIALTMARYPGLTSAQARDRLLQHVVPRTASDCPRGCGAGLLDLGFISN